MGYECLDLELIQNREIVTVVYAETSSLGQLLICHGCGDVEAVIVGFLVDEQSEQAWAFSTTRQETFMKMLGVQAGLGFGVKKFNVIFVFNNFRPLTISSTPDGYLGVRPPLRPSTRAKDEAMAGAVAVAPGVWVYQLTESGLALELTLKGTKYYKDSELNSRMYSSQSLVHR
jgi:lipid-binding SYLF domain-containing protein